MKIEYSGKYFIVTVWLSAAISILVHFSRIVEEVLSYDIAHESLLFFVANIFSEFFITFIISIVLFNFNYFTLNPYRSNQSNRIFKVIVSFLISFAIVYVLSHFLFTTKNELFNEIIKNKTQFVML